MNQLFIGILILSIASSCSLMLDYGDEPDAECVNNIDCNPEEVCSDPACDLDREWANWKVEGNGPKQLIVETGTVSDPVTGLVWVWQRDAEKMNWNDAKNYCASLSTAGGGWRLPTRIELLSIADPTKVECGNPSKCIAIDTEVFRDLNLAHLWYWSSTPAANDSNQVAWTIHFYSGTAKQHQKEEENYCFCVR